jgi:methylenetetrahydrofolate reductase (NADPH)
MAERIEAQSGLLRALEDPGRFATIVELAPWRGPSLGSGTLGAREMARGLQGEPRIDALSLTDGAGGRLSASPEGLAKELVEAGAEVVFHVTCRDRNRNDLVRLGWRLQEIGVRNVLALSGDYPLDGSWGVAKAVFDIDSVALLELYDALGSGRIGSVVATRRTRRDRARSPAPAIPAGWRPRAGASFYLGAAVNPYKRLESERALQEAKLALKARSGARFAITQIGFDLGELARLARFVLERHLDVRLVAGVALLDRRSAKAFHSGAVPGVEMSDALFERVEQEATSNDDGRAFFIELAARWAAAARWLGYAGVYLSGGHRPQDYIDVLERLKALEQEEGAWLLEDASWPLAPAVSPAPFGPREGRAHRVVADRGGTLVYGLSKAINRLVLAPESIGRPVASALVNGAQALGLGRALHLAEQAIKVPLYGCRDCGDCSLEEVAYLCPESQCVKNQRNGPCGGSRDGECEVPGLGCVWVRAYERRRRDGTQDALFDRPVTIQDNALRGTSSWANYLLGRDHTATGTGHGARPDQGPV